MITTVKVGHIVSHLDAVKTSWFTGKPVYRSTAEPSVRAVFINGRVRKPRDGMDWIIFGRSK